MRINIPPRHRVALADLISLTDTDFLSLKAALAEAKPTTAPLVLARRVAATTSLAPKRVEQIVDALVALIRARDREDLSTERIAKDVTEVLSEEKVGDVEPNAERATAFEPQLRELLDLDQSLGITSRALTVLNQHKHIYQSARVLTDVRPVFSRGNQPLPVAGMIVHNLEIETQTDGELLRFFVALDTQDVRALAQVIDRALRKEDALRRVIQKTNLAYVDVVPSGE